MKINSLHLFNWLSHQDTTLALDTITSIRGENGGGKTSVEAALEMLFCGRSSQTDDKGSGSRDLIRQGCDKSAITVEIQDAALLGARTAKMRCSITEKSGRTISIKDPSDESWTGSDFLSALASKREILDCLINGRFFFDMKPAEQKALLAAIILPTTVQWDIWTGAAVNECGLRVDWSLKAFDVIQMGYDAAFEARKLVNKAIKEWREPEPVAAQEMDTQTIRARLSERQAERTNLAVERGRATDKWQRAQTAKSKAKERIGALEFKLSTEQSRRADVAKDKLSTKGFKEATSLAAGAEKGAAIEAEIHAVGASIAELRRTLAKLNDIGEAGTCPTCTQPVTDAEFEFITAPIIARQDELLKREMELQAARKDLSDYDGAQKVLEAHAQAEKNLALVEEHVAGIEKDIRELTADIDNATESTAPDTTEIDKKIADLDGRIEKGNAALTAAIQAETKRQQYIDAMAAKKKLDAKQSLLERLVEYFGPKGIQAKLLDKHVGGFEASMNKVLATWGFACHLQFEPYQFSLSFSDKPAQYNLRTISKSQKYRFSVAFQVALAKVSGFNFVVVDEADILLDANRGQLYRALVGAGLDQVIVLQSDLRREIPKVPNSAFYLFTLDESGDVPTTKVERLT
jgi:prefoldin subunit 5